MSKFTESAALVNMRSRFLEPWPPTFSVKDGWANLLISCHLALASVDANYRLYQVKEKFGALRVYVAPSDESFQLEINNVTGLFSSMSMFVCEDCGSPGRMRVDYLGWYFTSCEQHSHDCKPIELSAFSSFNNVKLVDDLSKVFGLLLTVVADGVSPTALQN